MKTIPFKFIIAAVAVMAVSASCQKETVGDSAGNVADGVRVISVQFNNSTRAVLGSDGLTPKFENNDRIRVSNATRSEECTISVSNGNASFQAGQRRMRLIFLTSCTTALGVLPMIVSGDLLWMPMGVAICFGTMLSDLSFEIRTSCIYGKRELTIQDIIS